MDQVERSVLTNKSFGMDLRPGTIISGPTEGETIEIVDLIGRGAFGSVYRATRKDGAQFAVKTITTGFVDKTGLLALQNEDDFGLRRLRDVGRPAQKSHRVLLTRRTFGDVRSACRGHDRSQRKTCPS